MARMHVMGVTHCRVCGNICAHYCWFQSVKTPVSGLLSGSDTATLAFLVGALHRVDLGSRVLLADFGASHFQGKDSYVHMAWALTRVQPCISQNKADFREEEARFLWLA